VWYDLLQILNKGLLALYIKFSMSASSRAWKVNKKCRIKPEQHYNVVDASTSENNNSERGIHCGKVSTNTALARNERKRLLNQHRLAWIRPMHSIRTPMLCAYFPNEYITVLKGIALTTSKPFTIFTSQRDLLQMLLLHTVFLLSFFIWIK
jgi:hypothetical protein